MDIMSESGGFYYTAADAATGASVRLPESSPSDLVDTKRASADSP